MNAVPLSIITGFCGLIALGAIATNPIFASIGLALLVFIVFFVWATLEYPVASLCAIILVQVLIPTYVRIPVFIVPSIPPALMLLAAFIGILMVKGMMKSQRLEIGASEKALTQSIMIFNGALLFTVVISAYPFAAFPMWVKTILIPSLLFLAFLKTIPDTKALHLIYKVLLVSAVVCGVLAIHEFITHENVVANLLAPRVTAEEDFFLWFLFEGNREELSQPYRVYSFFTQPLEFSAFMVMVAPFALLSLIHAKTWSGRLIYGAAFFIVIAGFVVTFSRGPTLALIVTILSLAVLEKPLRRWIVIGTVCLIPVLILASSWILSQGLIDRIKGSKNVSLRFRLWENGMALFQENPFFFGIGYGAYPSVHAQSIRDNQIGPMYEYPWVQIERVTTVENIYITLAAETGLLGLAAFAFILLIYSTIILKILKLVKSGEVRLLALSSLGGVLAYLLSGLTVANIIGYTITIIFFGVFLASAAVLARLYEKPGGELLTRNGMGRSSDAL